MDLGHGLQLEVAVLVPCRNEERSVGSVIADFSFWLPGCTVYVYDNCSTDETARVAREAGAIVRMERRPGKGQVVKRMLADVEADVYLIVDGDGTYEAAAAPAMLKAIVDDHLDLVTGIRQSADTDAAYRRGHVLGNQVFTRLHRWLFGDGCSDVFSGYRVMSRRFAKSFPASSDGFEIEAELTAHALDVGASMGEVPCAYIERAHGSESKLRTYRDGVRILLRSLIYFKEAHPFRFFAAIGTPLIVTSIGLGIPVVLKFAETHTVPRLPTALLSVGLMLVACIALTCGIILDSLTRARRETKRLHYLSFPVPTYSLNPATRRDPAREPLDAAEA